MYGKGRLTLLCAAAVEDSTKAPITVCATSSESESREKAFAFMPRHLVDEREAIPDLVHELSLGARQADVVALAKPGLPDSAVPGTGKERRLGRRREVILDMVCLYLVCCCCRPTLLQFP